MKKTRLFMSLFILVVSMIVASIALAAEGVTTAAVSQSWMEWFSVNAVVVLGAALAVSEALALTPWFKGNGILDAIIKALGLLLAKKKASGQ